MVKTTVYLDEETAAALHQLAVARGRPQAELVREALDDYVRRSPGSKPRAIGRYHSGRSDVSELAEEILHEAVKQRRWP